MAVNEISVTRQTFSSDLVTLSSPITILSHNPQCQKSSPLDILDLISILRLSILRRRSCELRIGQILRPHSMNGRFVWCAKVQPSQDIYYKRWLADCGIDCHSIRVL